MIANGELENNGQFFQDAPTVPVDPLNIREKMVPRK